MWPALTAGFVSSPAFDLVIDYFRWRSEDAHRNALNSHCYWCLRKDDESVAEATAAVKGLTTAEKNELLFQHGINYNDLPRWQKRGSGLYWEEYEREAESHYVLDGGKLVVAHAGMKEEMQGRGSGKVREFALYGETTGETDEFGLPVRYNWAAEYRGRATVVYGHTPVPEPEWLNRTIEHRHRLRVRREADRPTLARKGNRLGARRHGPTANPHAHSCPRTHRRSPASRSTTMCWTPTMCSASGSSRPGFGPT